MSTSTAESTLLKEEIPLVEMTEEVRKGKSISWYRTPLTSVQIKELHAKSDLRGAWQTLGYLGIYAVTAGNALYSVWHWPWWVTALLVFLHGMVAAFLINAVHELGHGTVFRTRWLNVFFCHVMAFLGWINHEMFQSSHVRHHRYTLHPPDDLEVVLPIKLYFSHILQHGIVNLGALPNTWKGVWRKACGRFDGEWELTLYPEGDAAKRVPPIRWARFLFLGHALILLLSALTGQWMLTVVLSLTPAYGSWLFFLCNDTQHVGLQDNVADFRLCTRTFTLNPLVRFLYWQMNFHIEHHMYAAVPCYHLKKLHRLIRHDLPPTPQGLIGVWKDILAILQKQEQNPDYQHVVPLPARAP